MEHSLLLKALLDQKSIISCVVLAPLNGDPLKFDCGHLGWNLVSME